MAGYDPAEDSFTKQFSQPTAAANPSASGGDPATQGLSAWSSAAPGLPPGLLLQFAQSGVSPADPVGKWVIQTGMPALGSQKPVGANMTEGLAASRLLGNPQLLAKIKALPLDKQEQVFKMTAVQAGALSDQDLQRLADTGATQAHHGLLNKIGDVLTTGARDVFTGLQAPMEYANAGIRHVVGSELEQLDKVRQGDLTGAYKMQVQDFLGGAVAGGPANQITPGVSAKVDETNTLKIPWTGAKITAGPAANNPVAQTTLGQALQGKDLGGGFFPGGEAQKAAVQAQQQAANINGHALTTGRALASVVVQPGSRPYNILSGIVDATVAIKGDPSANALGEISDSVKGSRIFAQTTDAARSAAARHIVETVNDSAGINSLRDWTGLSKDAAPDLTSAIAQKLKSDPGSLQQLVDQGLVTNKDVLSAVGRSNIGGINAWRNLVDRPTALTWLNSGAGQDYADWAAKSGFTDIWLRSGKNLPVDVAAQLHDARTADEVRQILGQNLGTLIRGVPEGVMPYAWQKPIQSMRLFQYLPKDYVDASNVDQAVEQTWRMLRSAKVPVAFYDDMLADIAKTGGDYNGFKQAYGRAIDAIKDTISPRLAPEAVKVDPQLANHLTRYLPYQTMEDQARFVDQMGNMPTISGMTMANDGANVVADTVPLAGPHMSSELLNRALPTLDMRAIKRNVDTWGKVWNNPIAGPLAKSATYMADALTGTFKVFSLLKLALPVRFLADEQARMATAGVDSMFHHPLSYIAGVIGHKWDVDKLGEEWASQAGDMQSAYRRAVGESAQWSGSIFDADSQLSKDYRIIPRESEDYARAWADELSHLHMTPESREVARAMQDVNYTPAGVGRPSPGMEIPAGPETAAREASNVSGLDAVKEWFWHGAGQNYRTELARANLGWGSAMMRDSRQAADAYIDSVVERVKTMTSEDPEFLSAVADGHPFGLHGTSPDFVNALRSAAYDEGLGPDAVRGLATTSSKAKPEVLRNMVDRMFGALMDTPTTKLTRAPMFKQTYLQRFDELAPAIKDGSITAQQADAIAKSHALQSTRDLLYYPGERTNVTDTLRNIAPFGEAWRNVIKTWTALGAENPQVFRRIQQGVTAARGSGFFYQDPQSGQEVFTLVPADIMKHLAGVPFPMTAPVQGLNIAGQGLPGVGPAVQMPASVLLPKGNSVTDALRQHLLPYGSPDYTGGFFESMFPGWADKLRTSGWLLHYLPGDPQLPFFSPDANKKRVLGDLAHSVFQYHVSAGHYDLSNPDVLQKLSKQSMWEAQKLYLFRSLGQFAAPAAPTVTPEVQKPGSTNGTLMETWKLTKDFQTMEKTYPTLGDAVLNFVQKYGPKYIFATEPHAQRMPWAIPTTEEAAIWRNQNSDFANEFPNVYKYWAPTEGAFSYQTYLDQIQRGEAAPLSVDKWAKLADARLGNAIYSNIRGKLGPSPSQTDRNWLDQVKVAIQKQYPGFNDDSLKVQRQTLDQTVTELKAAVNNSAVKDSPLGQAASIYLRLRDEALQAAQNRSGSAGAGLSGKSTADLRDWLYQAGTKIAVQYPDFSTMWNDLFLPEVEPTQAGQ